MIMRKNILLSLLLTIAFLVCGCDDRTPVERANELLKARHFQTVQSLDSVMGYSSVHSQLMAAYNLYWHTDSVLVAHKNSNTPLTRDEREELLADGDIAYKLKLNAAKDRLTRKLNKEPETLQGYSVVLADSTSGSVMTVYFDKDIKRIVSIDKK